MEEYLKTCTNKGYHPRWIFHQCRADGIKITIYDFYTVAKHFGYTAFWVNEQTKEFHDILKKKDKDLPNIYFKGTYENHYALKKALLDWKKKLFTDSAELDKMQKQYFHYLSKKRGKINDASM